MHSRRVTDRSRPGPVETTAVPVNGTAHSPTTISALETAVATAALRAARVRDTAYAFCLDERYGPQAHAHHCAPPPPPPPPPFEYVEAVESFAWETAVQQVRHALAPPSRPAPTQGWPDGDVDAALPLVACYDKRAVVLMLPLFPALFPVPTPFPPFFPFPVLFLPSCRLLLSARVVAFLHLF
ncbi:hypothetical protein B0H11DRAFT_2273233 [Mycena galericulata]|nr:hypothetical protein B0H11DRAFT_2273233 [Mycena galericulata]